MKLNRDIFRKLPLGLRIQIEENAQRKPLTQSELAIEQRRILAELRKHKTPGERTDLKPETSGKTFPEVRATDLVGKLFNESRKQVEKRLAIVDAAEAEPEKYGKLLADMDRTGRAHGPYKRLRMLQQAEQIRAEPPPLPSKGPYRAGVIDLPWPYELHDDDPSHRAVRPYPTMSIEEMCKLPIGEIMHADAVLWMWIPNWELVHGAHLDILRAWRGFEPKTLLTWAKDKMGHGDWLRCQTEHAIMAVRGKPVVTLTNQTTLLHAPVRGNSEKPREFYDLVESLCPAPRYADLFSRYRHNDKWDCHGDEAPGNDAVATKRHLDARRKRNPAPEGER
jgi:N6-adenosine-specific RNA methylase IME4